MEPDLKKILEALLLSTADPISVRDLVKLFARHHEELVEAMADDEGGEEESPTAPAKVGEAELREAITSLMEAAEQEDPKHSGEVRVCKDHTSAGPPLDLVKVGHALLAWARDVRHAVAKKLRMNESILSG